MSKTPPSSKQAEEALLGCLLAGSDYITEAAGSMSADMFYYPDNQKIMRAILAVHASGKPVDIITAANELKRQIGSDEGRVLIMELSSTVMSDMNVAAYAKVVIQKYINREAIRRAMEIQEAALSDDLDTVISESSKMGDELLNILPSSSSVDISAVFADNIKEIDARVAGHSRSVYVDCNIRAIDRVIGGFDQGSLVIIAGRPSMGKAQPLYSKILTDNGWTTMGELKLGQRIASVDGQDSHVIGLFPQGIKQSYLVKFSDGRNAECSEDHLWSVTYRDWESPRVLTTKRIMEMLSCKRYQGRLWIDTPSGHYGNTDELPISPWLVGVMIGNGCLTDGTPRLSTASNELLEIFEEKIDTPQSINKSGKYDYRISAKERGMVNEFTENLREIGLMGCHSYDKFIPKQYLYANRRSRVELLSGLLATDGYIDRGGQMSYSTSSKQLAEDVIELARSLGAWARIRTKSPFYTYKGERKEGLLSYTCYISGLGAEDLILPSFKGDRVRSFSRVSRVTFQSITPTVVTEMQCIAVSHPSKLYITDDYVVTHNTAMALQLAFNMSSLHACLFFTLEMTREEIVNRYLVALTSIDIIRLKRATSLTGDEWKLIEKAGKELEDHTIIIDDSATLSIYNLKAKIYRMVRSRGVRVVFIDYLQLMEGAKGKDTVEYYGSISRTCKQIAKELKIVIILLSQLSRDIERRGEKIPRLHDLRSSGEIEQDADIVIFPVRCDRAGIDDPSKGLGPGKAVISIAKNRNGMVDNVVINVSSNAANWWDENDYVVPREYVAPSFQIDG